MAQRWLLVGSTGRVGRMIAAQWRAAPPSGAEIVFQHRGAAAHVPTGANALDWSPLDGPAPLAALCDRAGPVTTLLMLAGTTPATGTDMAVNEHLARACLDAAAACGIRRVLLASSSAVYGAGGARPFTEDDALRPVNAYGAAKVAMEAACAPFRDRGIEAACLRIGNVAGADALLLNAARAGSDGLLRIDRFADGEGPRRSYIGPATLARVLARLAGLAAPLPAAINVGVPGPVAMTALATAAGVPWAFVPASPGALQDVVMECALLAGLYPFTGAERDPAAIVAEARRLAANGEPRG